MHDFVYYLIHIRSANTCIHLVSQFQNTLHFIYKNNKRGYRLPIFNFHYSASICICIFSIWHIGYHWSICIAQNLPHHWKSYLLFCVRWNDLLSYLFVVKIIKCLEKYPDFVRYLPIKSSFWLHLLAYLKYSFSISIEKSIIWTLRSNPSEQTNTIIEIIEFIRNVLGYFFVYILVRALKSDYVHFCLRWCKEMLLKCA